MSNTGVNSIQEGSDMLDILGIVLVIVIIGVTPAIYRIHKRIAKLEERVRQLEGSSGDAR